MLLDTGTEHPKTNIPFIAVIDGRQFSGRSLSLVSASVSGLAGPELEAKERIAVLRFDFDGLHDFAAGQCSHQPDPCRDR